ncbi:MAG: DNA-directed RNA polymerase subunit beta' [Lachnospiraceae bacterium]|nr:DNA-directed RNA polymerase subunit beta' [Lachnospiraceae bacterium]
MSDLKNNEYQPVRFDSIRIGLASPEKIREWSTRNNDPEAGIVTKPETINYRTLKPEKDGLFCQRIFGPSKDWECACGKYRKIRYKGVICDKCGVEVTKSSVRRERMGRIELAAPVSHIWYFKGIPSRMGLLLDLTPKILEKVLYFASYIVLDPGDTDLEFKQVLSEHEYQEAREKYGIEFRVGMGAEAIKELLEGIDLEKDSAELKAELADEATKGQKKAKIVKRLEVVEAFRESGNAPSWMIMDTIPVIPPDLRPMVQLDGGRFATSDLNDLYRRIINRNNRLQKLLDLSAPDIIVRNEKRMLQEAVDALIDNGRRGRLVTGPGNRALKSLSDMLKGKSGRFRQNLLGKRVDYSGRSVIVVGPELKIYQCGLPKEMAIELFKPFVMRELERKGICQNIKAAKKMVERQNEAVWDVLEEVITEHPVMLNRAPTLHRLGIQAFEPVLVEGKAIKLHPLVCTAFNADFDGDQMAIHLPLSVEAQAECRFMLLSPNNLLKPSDGAPVAVPSQDMVLGIYYLTQMRTGEVIPEAPAEPVQNEGESSADFEKRKETYKKELADHKKKYAGIVHADGVIGEGNYYKDLGEAILAYENGVLDLHAPIKVRITKAKADGTEISGVIDTSLGRMLFNEILPQDLGFAKRDENDPVSTLVPEITFLVDKKMLKKILEKVINIHGATRTAEVLDLVKAIGYKYSTRAAMTVSISDIIVPAKKTEIIDAAQAKVDEITRRYRRGFSTDDERHNEVIRVWNEADAALTEEMMGGLAPTNNIRMMADSGARGSQQQMKQLAGMRGLMGDTQGRTIELPIKSNFREGLDVLEYFISAHGARKGLSDTALRTADSGYLTRRMVDVCQELIIRETDCSADREEIPHFTVEALVDGKDVVESLENRVRGRFAAEDVKDDAGNVIVKANHMITPARAEAIAASNIESVKIRSILTCKCKVGICAKCYGANMATGEPVQVGEAVGIIAAQSIGEPGTQLTMRTFHSGGVAGNDITQGLPRVEELFEARRPKGLAIISAVGGTVELIEEKQNDEGSVKRKIVIKNDEDREKEYDIPFGAHIKVMNGQVIEAGDELTEGSVDPHDLLEIKKIKAVEDYLIREVQKVYGLQGVDLADKHIEVIVRQMLKKQRIEDAGDSDLLPGSMADRLDIEELNEKLVAEGKRPVVTADVVLGITKAALATDSFMSAASFQETTKVLTDAAIKGKVDHLIGLKENVIIGKLIPAGTGIPRYRDVRLDVDDPDPADEDDLDFSEEQAVQSAGEENEAGQDQEEMNMLLVSAVEENEE